MIQGIALWWSNSDVVSLDFGLHPQGKAPSEHTKVGGLHDLIHSEER